jgi:hypothetical protein
MENWGPQPAQATGLPSPVLRLSDSNFMLAGKIEMSKDQT